MQMEIAVTYLKEVIKIKKNNGIKYVLVICGIINFSERPMVKTVKLKSRASLMFCAANIAPQALSIKNNVSFRPSNLNFKRIKLMPIQ